MGGTVPLFVCGGAGSHLAQCGLGRETYLRTKWHLDPSNRLATIHQRDRQRDRIDRTGQRSDSIGRTFLQTVAPKKLGKFNKAKISVMLFILAKLKKTFNTFIVISFFQVPMRIKFILSNLVTIA